MSSTGNTPCNRILRIDIKAVILIAKQPSAAIFAAARQNKARHAVGQCCFANALGAAQQPGVMHAFAVPCIQNGFLGLFMAKKCIISAWFEGVFFSGKVVLGHVGFRPPARQYVT